MISEADRYWAILALLTLILTTVGQTKLSNALQVRACPIQRASLCHLEHPHSVLAIGFSYARVLS
jgi:hypothetical protein